MKHWHVKLTNGRTVDVEAPSKKVAMRLASENSNYAQAVSAKEVKESEIQARMILERAYRNGEEA